MATSFPASKPISAVRRLAGTSASVAGTPSGSSGRRKSRRIVRQSSFFERFTDLPFTLQLKIEAWWDELDFADLGYPAGLALNGANFVVKLGTATVHYTSLGRERISQWNILRSSESQAEQRLEQLQQVKAGGFSLGTYLSFFLLLLSVANAGYLWTRKRTYQLRNRAALVKSPSAYWVETETREPQGLFAKIKDLLFGFFNEPPERSRIQHLDVWTPDELSLRIFTLYPPPVSFLWLLLNGDNWYILLVAIGLTLVQSNLLVYKYSSLVQDKTYVQAEVMHEYDKSFVYPIVFKPRRSVGVQTNEAEMVERPWRRRSSVMPSHVEQSDFDLEEEEELANSSRGSLLERPSSIPNGMRKSTTSGSIATQTQWQANVTAKEEDMDDSFGHSQVRHGPSRRASAIPQRSGHRRRRESAM